MRICIDIEINGLNNPDKIWVIICKDIDTKKIYIFRNVHEEQEKNRFIEFSRQVKTWIGHNILGFDFPVLVKLIDFSFEVPDTIDTLICSRLIDYPRKSHSIRDYGVEFGYEKGEWTDWTKYSLEMEEYCLRDVEICHKIYLKYSKYISNSTRVLSILLEHNFEYYVINSLKTNGFYINKSKLNTLLNKVLEELNTLDTKIALEYRSRLRLKREIIPKATKYGTISLSSIPKALRENIHEFTVDAPFSYCEWVDFNPSSHKQLIEVLSQSGWEPEDKTETHKDIEREYNNLLRSRVRDSEFDLRKDQLYNRLLELRKTGWKINEHNLDTLPSSAPSSARLLAKRILLESRRRTLTEWQSLLTEDSRIHGEFVGIGAWTHRMAHRNPNTANIPNEFDTQGKKKLYGKELRSLWAAPKNRLLVGCDAEGIQLRIFAHYINDPEFTQALVNGKKEDKSDPHSLNQSILGDVCKSRAAAKRFIYALLLGAGIGKLAEILDCDKQTAEEALGRLIERYTGFAHLKETIIPADAKRGWFVGLDGRAVRIPGENIGSRRHLAMSGYLQCGEVVIIKTAALSAYEKFKKEQLNCFFVNIIHDEFQVECENNVATAIRVGEILADSIREAGEKYNLRCPLAGSFWDADHNDYTIGTNWSQTH